MARAALWKPYTVVGGAPQDGFTRVGGIVHVHTSLSDGSGTPEEVVAAAKRAGAAFVVITDHNNLDAKPIEGYRDGILAIVGTEISTNAGHVLGLGIADPVYRFSGDAADGIEDVRDLGGASIVAHPLSPRPDFAWTGWDLPGWRGMELLNGDSLTRSAGWWRLLRAAAVYRANPSYALLTSLTPPDEALARWDRALASRDVSGIAGADAHSRLPWRKDRSVRFPSYEALFAVLRNYVVLRGPLVGDAVADERTVLEALANGHAYMAVEALAPASSFSFVATGGGRSWTMGETAPAQDGLALRVSGAFPAGARIRVLRDGALLTESTTGEASVTGVQPGVYRCEIWLSGWPFPWILSNPIAVFDDQTRDERRRRLDAPSPPPAPEPTRMLDDFETTGIFQREHDPTTIMPGELPAPGAGADRSTAAFFECRLGVPDHERPHTYCALISRKSMDATGFSGLTFRIRGDGAFRTWVQLRDANVLSADDGLEYWYASVRSSVEWRRVAVPFARFHSFNPKTDGRLDLDKIKEFAFVIDKGALKPGATARIWLDDVGLY